MSILRYSRFVPLLLLALVLRPAPARAQVTLNESGFVCVKLSGDFAKQAELGVGPGPDTCLYYGSFEGLRRRCAPADTGTVCDETLTFPAGIAFSSGGSFGNNMYVSDWGVGDIHRSAGCGPTTTFATLPGPGSIVFPPSGSAYGDYLYTCAAFDGPIYRVNSAGVLSEWADVATAYLRFGPGGAWGTGMYASYYDMVTFGGSGIVKVSSTGAVTPFVDDYFTPEGFDWGFDGDMFATDASFGEIRRVKANGVTTVFATLAGAADVAYRAGRDELYVVSNQGGLYVIRRGSALDVADGRLVDAAPAVSPNPAHGACTIRFVQRAGGLSRVSVVDAQGRVVRRLPETWRPAGAQALAWDGRDEAGVPVRAGAYFMRVLAGGEARNARVTIVR